MGESPQGGMQKRKKEGGMKGEKKKERQNLNFQAVLKWKIQNHLICNSHNDLLIQCNCLTFPFKAVSVLWLWRHKR